MSSLYEKPSGSSRILRAAVHSCNGLVAAYRHEQAFRQECWGAIVLLPFAPWLGRGWVETTLLMMTVVLVLIVELLNSSLEAAIDRVSLDIHHLSKHAKDVASASVFLSLLLCAGVWISALWQRLSS